MNRTQIYLASAAVLALVALVIGVPRLFGHAGVGPAPQPFVDGEGSIRLVARLSHPYLSASDREVFATLELEGVEVPGSRRSPVNLALVIDRSGSMAGDKLTHAKQAARQLVSQLGPNDRLAIVHYGSTASALPGALATDEAKARMLAFIDGIWDDGGTNIGQGLTMGRDLLLSAKSDFKVNRLILISDGQPTEGLTDVAGLTALAKEIRGHGVSVSSIGVGTEFNEDLMAAFAEVGGGAYGYLSDTSQLASIFAKDLDRAGTQVARDVRLRFELPAGVELGSVFGQQVRREGNQVTVTLPDFSAGQRERVVARLEVQPGRGGERLEITAFSLEYFDLLASSDRLRHGALAAQVTDSSDVVARNLDKEASVLAARAQSADNTRRAAEALANGHEAQAQQLLDQNRVFFEAAAKVAGEAAVADDRRDNAALIDDFSNARDEESVRASTKAAKRKARIDYGLSGSTY